MGASIGFVAGGTGLGGYIGCAIGCAVKGELDVMGILEGAAIGGVASGCAILGTKEGIREGWEDLKRDYVSEWQQFTDEHHTHGIDQ